MQLKFQAQLSMKSFKLLNLALKRLIALNFMLVSQTPTISTVVLEYMVYVSVPVQREVLHKQVGIHRVTQVNMGVL